MAGQLEFGLSETPRRVALNVTQLVRVVRETLEVHLGEYWVTGEVSNARMAPSNHLYFTLKDARSSINVVMFSSAARRLRFRIEDGLQVLVRGRVNLYEARGTLQLYAEAVEPRGLGALQLAFEQLKDRLTAEGLFDASIKRALPQLPQIIGIVTALGGAVLQDLLRILLDRYPNLHVIIRPSTVQGSSAVREIVGAIDDLNRDGRAELIIVARGGGSLEDLWPFNDEGVARAIRGSAVPVISAVGHEVDYTIADFAADLRALTPSAAAQIAVPLKADLRRRLDEFYAVLHASMRATSDNYRRHVTQVGLRVRDPGSMIRQARQRLDENTIELDRAIGSQVERLRRRVRELESALGAFSLRINLAARRLGLQHLSERLETAARAAITAQRARLGTEAHRLDAVSPLRVLERGYAVVTNNRIGRVVTDAREVEAGDELQIRLAHGRIRAAVLSREL
jgi:exodeoxyribonuclease VII large subunit